MNTFCWVYKQAIVVFFSMVVTPWSFAEANLSDPILIRPFGDSITFGVGFNNLNVVQTTVNHRPSYFFWPPAIYGGGYRGFMTVRAVHGISHLQFSTEGQRRDGSIYTQWATYSQLHDGYPGYTNSQLNAIANNASAANFTLVHSGTNDILQGSTAATAIAHLKTLLQTLLANNTTGTILVAQIIPIPYIADGCPGCAAAQCPNQCAMRKQALQEYNQQIPTLLAELSPRLIAVDMSQLLTVNEYTLDGIHPNALGYEMMAYTWETAIHSAQGQTSDSFTSVMHGVERGLPVFNVDTDEKLMSIFYESLDDYTGKKNKNVLGR